jgi:hypothetical protein
MLVTPKAIMVTSTTTVIQDMNARALSHMEQGRNQDAVQVLLQATRHVSTWVYLEEVMARYQEVMAIASADCAQPWQTVRDLDTWMNQQRYQGAMTTSSSGCAYPWHASAKDAREASAFSAISLVAVSPFSNILIEGSGGISSHMIHHHAVPLPQLCHGRDIYNCAFCLPFSDEAIASVEYRTQAIAIIVYNMALADHRYGIQSGKSEPLAHAAIAYNKVLDIVGPNAMQLFPDLAVIVLGIMGNLAHIHLELRQMPEFISARSCLRELMRYIRLDQMSAQDFGFFNLQLFCFDREAIWYAPAA